ncbi:hypothetical protein [Streptomyces sp. WG7]|uniref:hypothetical protein n=1 Tax=Streptomyces sp. WG7 TaxID=3417650 RepID=UPI003CF3A5DC
MKGWVVRVEQRDEAGGRIPRARAMRAHAAASVRRATAGDRLPLDCSPAGPRIGDFPIGGVREGGTGHERAPGTLRGPGAHADEVRVRRAGPARADRRHVRALRPHRAP